MKIKISKTTHIIPSLFQHERENKLELNYSLFEVKSKESIFSHWKKFPTTYNHFDEALFFVENLELFGEQIAKGNHPFSLSSSFFSSISKRRMLFNKITKKTINYKTESATYYFK